MVVILYQLELYMCLVLGLKESGDSPSTACITGRGYPPAPRCVYTAAVYNLHCKNKETQPASNA